MLTPISYNGGTIWVDKEATTITGDICYLQIDIHEQVSEWDGDIGWDTRYKVVAQSTSLSLPNIPYVELPETKISYTEENLKRAYYEGVSFGATEEYAYNKVIPKINSLLESLQSKIKSIEIQMAVYRHPKNLVAPLFRPVTYQKEGRTFLKVKKIDHE